MRPLCSTLADLWTFHTVEEIGCVVILTISSLFKRVQWRSEIRQPTAQNHRLGQRSSVGRQSSTFLECHVPVDAQRGFCCRERRALLVEGWGIRTRLGVFL